MAKKILGFFNKQKQFEQDVMENGMQYSSFYGDSLRRLKKNKMAMFCACVLILLALMAIFAPLLAPYDPTYQDYSAVLGDRARHIRSEPMNSAVTSYPVSSTVPEYPSVSVSWHRSSLLS